MKRREFIRNMGFGLAAAWVWGRCASPLKVLAQEPEFRLALLADAHLQNGDARRPEAQSLARAVAEIRTLTPAPRLVLFAGDLAHRGRPDALDLGREILADLPAPLLLVRGEGDGPAGASSAWTRRFGSARFSCQLPACHLLGVDTCLSRTASGPEFALGLEQIRGLARELAKLDPATPLLILSHAPLTPIFHPWQQWTADGAALYPLLARFQTVACFHGHVHQAGGRESGPGIRKILPGPPLLKGNSGGFYEGHTKDRIIHQGLPATSWPRPRAVQGTPATPRAGLGPQGCGWGLLALGPSSLNFQPQIWEV